MSVKYYKDGQWQIFPGTIGTPGKDAYIIAQENGYTGTKEEYNQILVDIPQVVEFIENADKIPTQGSNNLVQSGGTWQAIKDVKDQVDTLTNSITNDINEIKITEIPNQIKASIIDNLDSSAADKSLSANQGRILKEMISNLVNLRLQIVAELPERGETNIIYLIQKDGEAPDTYDEYVYIEDKWEKIGNTDVDLSNYYTKEDVYNKSEINEIKSQIESQISDVEVSNSGSGNVITSLEVDPVNKHKINVAKDIDVYTKSEIDSKLSDSGLGDVIAAAEFTTENRVIVSNGAGKVVKDSGVLIENLALKSYVDEKEISWDKVTGKPETYAPSEHKHNIADINDFPEIPDPIQVDSELSSSSENPVQNKVIDAALKNKLDSTALENYYNKEEIDSKISAAGGGDVVASGNLTDGYIVLGAGTKSVRDSFTRIEDLATQSWVNEQNYITSADITWDNIQNKPNLTEVIYIPLSILYMNEETSSEDIEKAFTDLNTTFDNIYNSLSRENVIYRGVTTLPSSTIMTNLAINVYNQNEGTTKALSFVINDIGVGIKVTISLTDNTYKVTESVNSSYLAEIKKATSGAIGGIKLGYVEADNNIAVNLNEEDRAYITINKNAIVSALGFTPVDSESIPATLPNPYNLKITSNNIENSYNGSSECTLNLDEIYSKQLLQLSNPEDAGKPGILFTDSLEPLNINIRVTKSDPDAIVIVPSSVEVTFSGTSAHFVQGYKEFTGGTYKCYCISLLNDNLVLVNCAIYE